MTRDGRVALPRGVMGLSAVFIVVLPDHTHLIFPIWSQTIHISEIIRLYIYFLYELFNFYE